MMGIEAIFAWVEMMGASHAILLQTSKSVYSTVGFLTQPIDIIFISEVN